MKIKDENERKEGWIVKKYKQASQVFQILWESPANGCRPPGVRMSSFFSRNPNSPSRGLLLPHNVHLAGLFSLYIQGMSRM